jgi:hypothetical protein
MTPERRRELAEKTWEEMPFNPYDWDHDWKKEAFQVLESAFLELEKEVREECARIAEGRIPGWNADAIANDEALKIAAAIRKDQP